MTAAVDATGVSAAGRAPAGVPVADERASTLSLDVGQTMHHSLAAPRVNALQKFWLREIGIEKTWLQAAEPVLAARDALSPLGSPTSQSSPAAQAVSMDVQDHGMVHAGALIASSLQNCAAEEPPSRLPGGSAEGRPPGATSRPRPPNVAPAPVQATPVARVQSPLIETAIATMDIEMLREQVQGCTACGLCQGRRHAVFGMGARPARWMVIGEAPGEQEDRQGLPFVGRSGQLLDAMLNSVGMSRERDVFIANVIKCRPPGNRNPKPEEIAACSPYLTRQIELVQPERILVLGRFAAQALLATDATIGSLRGRLHAWTTSDGRRIPVIVSYHPAYLLRSPVEKARAWQDLQLAATSG